MVKKAARGLPDSDEEDEVSDDEEQDPTPHEELDIAESRTGVAMPLSLGTQRDTVYAAASSPTATIGSFDTADSPHTQRPVVALPGSLKPCRNFEEAAEAEQSACELRVVPATRRPRDDSARNRLGSAGRARARESRAVHGEVGRRERVVGEPAAWGGPGASAELRALGAESRSTETRSIPATCTFRRAKDLGEVPSSPCQDSYADADPGGCLAAGGRGVGDDDEDAWGESGRSAITAVERRTRGKPLSGALLARLLLPMAIMCATMLLFSSGSIRTWLAPLLHPIGTPRQVGAGHSLGAAPVRAPPGAAYGGVSSIPRGLVWRGLPTQGALAQGLPAQRYSTQVPSNAEANAPLSRALARSMQHLMIPQQGNQLRTQPPGQQ